MMEQRCPIWGTEAEVIMAPGGTDAFDVDSPRAGGRYRITGTAKATLGELSPEERLKLTSWLVEQHMLGIERPEISTQTLKEACKRARLPMMERIHRLIRLLARLQEESLNRGAGEKISTADRPNRELVIAYSESRQIGEVDDLLQDMQSKGWVECDDKVLSGGYALCRVTMDGYLHLEKLRQEGGSSDQAFVAMWFHENMDSFYHHGIEPAVSEAGYRALRIDRAQFLDKIDDRIIAEIRRSRFLVADFTQGEDGARGGVYYEAGFAHGLGIPVIFTCRQDCIDQVHFDTRQYPHIRYANAEELKECLLARILATLGKGPDR